MRASQISCPCRVFPRPQPHGEKFEMASTEGNGILTEENFEQRLSLLIQGTEIILYIMWNIHQLKALLFGLDICSKRLELVTIVEDLG